MLLAYLLCVMAYLNFFRPEDDAVCRRIEVAIDDAPGQNYITYNEVVKRMKTAGVFPEGKPMTEINTGEIEEKLAAGSLIKKSECFKTAGGYVKIKVYHRIPVLRIFSPDGSYYVDSERGVMPVPDNFAAYVPVAGGNISREYATGQLYDFACYLQKNKFWNSQIAQIYIDDNRDVILTPVVGNHRIILGKIEDHKAHLEKLKIFYEKGLSKIGWNRYSTINLKYRNQVVCTLTGAALKARDGI
jgi:cell division protein FtsQ